VNKLHKYAISQAMIHKSNIIGYTQNWYSMGDPAIVRELGKSIKQLRINKNITQQQLAEKTGLDRVTISRFENGRAATLLTFVQILRSLNELELLNSFITEPEISPLKVAEIEEHYRKRASSKSVVKKQKPSEW
jgi:transcriptional regulator with XRE-family HTH domain